MRAIASRLAGLTIRETLSVGLLLVLVQVSSAAVVRSGLSVLVDKNNNVSVSSGAPNLFGDVGTAGTRSFINGWGVSSGATTWIDTNGNAAAILDSRGMVVPVSSRVANVSASGAVSITGTPALGAALRQSVGPGIHPFVSTFAQGSIPYEFSGTANILKNQATLIEGLNLVVNPNTFVVTVTANTSPVAFGDVGEAGSFALQNGWRVEEGDIHWRDTSMTIVASLDRRGLTIPVSHRLANSSPVGFATLSASTALGFALVTEFGAGTFAYSSLVAESLDTEFYIEGSVTINLALPGDYNQDGAVDAADYTAWRNNLGASAGTLPNDADGGVIGQAQYNTWKSNFGAIAGSGSSLSNLGVPEPCTAALFAWMVAIAYVSVRRFKAVD